MNLLDIHFWSQTFGMQTRMKVLLPERTVGTYARDLRLTDAPDFGGLYLLHGMGNDYTAWLRWTNVERYAGSRNLALIMPDMHLGWYTDMKHGFKYFTFLTEELPKTLHNFFPHLSQKREDTAVAGISMGGYGALKCALQRPDLYSSAGLFAGGYDIFGNHYQGKTATEPEELKLFDDIYGSEQGYLSGEGNLYRSAEAHREDKLKTRLFFCCGTRDRMYPCNVTMRDTLQNNGWDITYSEGDADHDFGYWDSELPSFFRWLDEGKGE